MRRRVSNLLSLNKKNKINNMFEESKEKTVSILDEAKKDFDLFHDNLGEYKNKVDSISELFNLKGEAKLQSDYLPTYFVGDIKDENYKYALFGINPFFSEGQNSIEETWKENSWEDYLDFAKNFFTLFHQHRMKSKYYEKISKIFDGLENLNFISNLDIYDYYQNHLINIDLIPYHSTNSGLPTHLSHEQMSYLKKRLDLGINFLKKQNNLKLIIFNGKPLYRMLIDNGLVDFYKEIEINKKVSMYFFQLDGIPCVLFEKFITKEYWGLTEDDYKTLIPDLIRGELNRQAEEAKGGSDDDSIKCTTNYLEL